MAHIKAGPAAFTLVVLGVLAGGAAISSTTPAAVDRPIPLAPTTRPAPTYVYTPPPTTYPTIPPSLMESYPTEPEDAAPADSGDDSGGDYDVDRHHHIPHPHVSVCKGKHIHVCL